MNEDFGETSVEREEVELPVVEAGPSPTSDKTPLKLRFSPNAGKHLNPAVRLAVACFVLCFVMLLVYGVMSRSQKRRAAAASPDEKRSFVAAGQAGAQVWQDMEDQRKSDALKAGQAGAQGGDPAPLAGTGAEGGPQQGNQGSDHGVPNNLVARNEDSGVVPPLVARTLRAPGADGRNNSGLIPPGRPAGTQQPYVSSSRYEGSGRRSPEEQWREQMYKNEMAARDASTSISGREGTGPVGGLAALANGATGGPAAALADLVNRYAHPAPAPGVAMPGGSAESSGDSDANMQEHKESFIDRAREGRVEHDYSSATRNAPLTKYEIKAGWDIPATLESAVNTDLPGEVKAVVRENVYDTATGRYLLIPQGSRLIGQYDNRVSYGQTRAIVIWNRLIFPDGSSVDLDGMIGHDASGAAGFHDKVDNHYVRLVSMALMLSAFTAGIEMSQPQTESAYGYLTPSQEATQALGQQFGQMGIEVTRKNLNIQPTVKVRVGYRFNVRVNRDIAFARPYSEGR